MIVLSAPTVLYVLSYTLPTNSVLGIGAAGGSALQYGLPFLLSAISSLILPKLTRVLVHKGLLELSEKQGARLISNLLVGSRFVTTVAFPVAAVVLLADECGQWWKDLWNTCRVPESPYFDIKTGITAPEYAFTTSELCSKTGSAASGQCARSLIMILGPLFAEKMAIAAFIQPALLLLFFETGIARRLHFIMSKPDGDSHQSYRMNFDLEFATVITWIEMALLYGYALPLILPLAATALGAHWLVYTWLLLQGKAGTYPCVLPSA